MDPDVAKRREGGIMMLYFFASVASSIMFVNRLENDSPSAFWITVLPMILVGAIHWGGYIGSRAKARRDGNPLPFITVEFEFITSLVPGLVILCIQQEVY